MSATATRHKRQRMVRASELRPGDKITHRTWCNELPVTEVISAGESLILLRESDGYEHGLHASMHSSLDDLLSSYWRAPATA